MTNTEQEEIMIKRAILILELGLNLLKIRDLNEYDEKLISTIANHPIIKTALGFYRVVELEKEQDQS